MTDQNDSEYVCEKCHGHVDAEASRCPNCGFDATDAPRRRAKRLGRIGVVLSLLLVTVPIGVPLVVYAKYRLRRAESATVAVRSASA